MLTNGSPAFTVDPFVMETEAIVPSFGATISFSIFMASRMQRTCPRVTDSPNCTVTSRIVPGIGALTSSLPAGAAEDRTGEGAITGGAAGAAAAGDTAAGARAAA